MQKRALIHDDSTDSDSSETKTNQAASCSAPIYCTLLPHCASLGAFPTSASYEAHYAQTHTCICTICNRSLPSFHYLDIHISETHDSYFGVLSEKQKSYTCLVEGCKDKMWTSKSRNRHCIDKHGFGKDYPFSALFGYGAGELYISSAIPKRINKTKAENINLISFEKNISLEPKEVQEKPDQKQDLNVDMMQFDKEFKKLEIPKNISFGRPNGKKGKTAWSFEHVKKEHSNKVPVHIKLDRKLQNCTKSNVLLEAEADINPKADKMEIIRQNSSM